MLIVFPSPLALTSTPSIDPSASELTRPASTARTVFWAQVATTLPTHTVIASKANFIRIFILDNSVPSLANNLAASKRLPATKTGGLYKT
jgi:hypothetical protein